MTRAIVIVLDSVGIGAAPDAERYGDEGSNTVGHIWRACLAGKANVDGMRSGPLHIPNLEKMGLLHAVASIDPDAVIPPTFDVDGLWGAAFETSAGKDTPSGHWELCGVPVNEPWTHFPNTRPSFPDDLVRQVIDTCRLPGILGNKHASGMDVISEFGEEHLRTGAPICYTSADSVFQIAAHEEVISPTKLYELCAKVFEITSPMRVGRVIARPFRGTNVGNFYRTGNRKDFTVEPPHPTLFDIALAAGRTTSAVGKIGDIFSYRGIKQTAKASSNMAMFDATLKATSELPEGGFLMSNFVDFDSEYGHRRDVAGYAHALEAFDARLPELIAVLRQDDLLIITADHGNDPTFKGSDHTREWVPVLGRLNNKSSNLGRRSMSDIGATVCAHLGIPPTLHGRSFLDQQRNDI